MAKGTIVIPTEKDGAEAIVEDIENQLATELGGVSIYRGRGSWINEDFALVSEGHARLMASDSDRDSVESTIRNCAEYVKSELGEDAVFTEITPSSVNLV